MEKKFETQSFNKMLKSMIKVDLRRAFTTPLIYIITGICLVIPILILVMTSMMDGTVSVNPTTGEETIIEGFKNVWQTIGSVSGSAMSMDLTGMCNINMLYFFIAVLVCLFISEDFKSGYAKNLFTVRARKTDYVISKTLLGFVGGVSMLVAFFIGAMLGGAITGLPFDVGTAGVDGIIMCMLSKILLVAVFVPIYVAVSVAAKQKAWLSIIGSIGVGMLMFTIIPMITPLDSTFVNVILCFVGGIGFSVGVGAISSLILRKTALV